MRWYVVLSGLLLTHAANAIECRDLRAPEFPIDTPIDQRAEKRLSRKVVRYMSDTGKFIVCLRKHDSEDPLTVTRENAALDALTGLLDRFETEIGHSEILVEEIKDLVPMARRATVERRVAAAVRNYEKEENFVAAREHLRGMISSGGLTQDQAFRARIALADVDVMLRLSEMVDTRARDQ